MVRESPPPTGIEPAAAQPTARLAMPDHAAPLAPGRVIGDRYELIEQIGEGGAARVYRARDRVLDRSVAVKVLREEHGHDPDFVARFYREARAVASLSHQNIVDIYDYGSDDGTNYIVMQYIEGTDLKTILRREGRLAPARAVAIVSGALRGLAAAHERGLIHRDVKPQNLLVRSSDGLVKLADFGVARALGTSRHTAEGTTFGTAGYMAPEQATGGEIGPATDLYAVGVVLYEALSGRLPYEGDTDLAVTVRHIHAPVPSLAAAAPGVPPALARVVEHALAKDPAARYPSADAFRRAISAAVGDQTTGFVARGVVPRVSPRAAPKPAATPLATAPPAIAPAAGRARSPLGGYGCLLSLLGVLIVGLALGLFALTRGVAGGGGPTATPPVGRASAAPAGAAVVIEPTPTRPGPTATSEPPVPTTPPTPAPAAPPTATATAVPPTPTIPPPTSTPVPPTATAPPPTATALPPTKTPILPTPTPVPQPAPATTGFSPHQLAGAYRRDDGTLYGLPTVALYGQGSGYNEGTVEFTLRDAPGGRVMLMLTGLDDERPEHCHFQVVINGRTIFDGADTFPNTPNGDHGVGGPPRYWGKMSIPVPDNTLREGRNTITLRNTTPGSRPGVPYILITDLQFTAR